MLEFLIRPSKKSVVFFLTILVVFTENPRIFANGGKTRQRLTFKEEVRCFPIAFGAVHPKIVFKSHHTALRHHTKQ